MQPSPRHSGIAAQAFGLLPNLCDNRVLLLLILIAELLAMVLTLSQRPGTGNLWSYLATSSFFIQSIALIDAALLCYTRRWLLRLPPLYLGITVYAGLQLVTVLVTLLQGLVVDPFGSGNSAGILPRNLGISAIISAVVMRYLYIRHQNELRQQAENNAKIQVLQARIRPHFLFNSLNTIASLIHRQPQQAEEAILDLAELFRSTLSQPEKITLAQEMELVQKYLHIESLRLGPRLKVESRIPRELMDLELPPLVLQPLVENAVYHGIEPIPEGGTVSIEAANQAGAGTVISIRNPRSSSPRSGRNTGNRMALDNIRQRLLLHYGKQAALIIDETVTEYTVKLQLPDISVPRAGMV
ncbi:MAG TPA: histidine kinase [Gammaproteobacteria bacterium]|nr:histidine kinase [Gammaproteobacteria bacterium]